MPTQPSKTLETFDNPQPNRDYLIHIEIPEFTSLCPLTGQPDFATLFLDYIPDKKNVELKALKLYIPASGVSWPMIRRNNVVFPAPLGPITPTMPLGGRENERSEKSCFLPNAFASPLASITLLPRRGPLGMNISRRSSRAFWSSLSSLS